MVFIWSVLARAQSPSRRAGHAKEILMYIGGGALLLIIILILLFR